MKICISAIGLWVATSLSIAATTAVPSIKISPATVTVRAGAKATNQTFTAAETGVTKPSTTFSWTLTGKGAAGTLGTLANGVYTPPAVAPSPNTVTVTVTDTTRTPALTASATITVLDPAPVISSLSPSSVNTGLKTTVSVTGSGFLPTDTLTVNGVATTATVVSSTSVQFTITSSAAAGIKLPITVNNPNSTASVKTSNTANLNVVAPVAVTVSPDNRTVRCGATLALTWRVVNNANQNVTWQVNGIPGGNSVYGTVTSTVAANATTLMYVAPAVLPPAPATPPTTGGTTTTTTSGTTNPMIPVKITAVAAVDPTASGAITVNLQNPTPVITSVNPTTMTAGPGTLTVNGTGFAQGAVVFFAGSAQVTKFVSDKQLTVTGTFSIPFGRTAAVKVANPSPGAVTSAPVAIPMQSQDATGKMSYADAYRFLEMASFGPTPASVAHLQAVGRDSWLTEQFAMPPSVWPNPINDNEGMNRLQTAFYNIALNGPDQLRQRVSFALAQIMVSSGAKDTQFSQMVSYQRLLGNDAFTTYRQLLGDMTLNPAMGFYLDMVNNNKANPAKGTVANENYAREVMQLFSLGLIQLKQDGTTVCPVEADCPEYTQDTVTQMAKVFTGWTYGAAPGYASQWTNQPYYFAPMVAFDSHHDMTAKVISLPKPCSLPANQSAVTDLNQALDCIATQDNVAPFIAYRLIQRLVMSNPSPAYVSRVAGVFKGSGGNLQSVVTAILTDGEANGASGKLEEPVLYATMLLRSLNANVADAGGLNNQSTAMGQNVMEPGSVFSYFSPFSKVSAPIPPNTNIPAGYVAVMTAPEFQGVNAATSIARANFAWHAVTNSISGTIRVDLSNLQDLAAMGPNRLLDAINQGLYRGQMGADVRSFLLTAATQNSASAAVRSALYAAAAAPQYQVQQ